MPVSISRLRRWSAAGALFVCIAVFGAYFYAKHRVQNAIKQVPGKIGLEIQQSAQGFTISKSEQGRTLFRLQAGKAIQFKQGGRTELHDVTITLYGRDSSRFDQIYGADFEYDQQSGNVTSTGEVSIDIQANPQGLLNPDQAPPKELKNPIHLRTAGLVFNKNTGDAWTPAEIDFRVPQASGSATGAKYEAKEGVLTLESQVKIVVNGATPATILAQQAILQKTSRQIVLRYPHAESPEQQGQADELTLFLRDDNTLDHASAVGNIRIHSSGTQLATAQAQKLEVTMGQHNAISRALLSDGVHLETLRPQSAEGSAGMAVLSFGSRNTITKIHATNQVRLLEHVHDASSKDQHVELTSPAMDFVVANGNRLARAETIGPPQISLIPIDAKQGQTQVIADRFTAKFDPQGQLRQIHGEAHARVATTSPPQNNIAQPNQISTSDMIDAYFRPGTGIQNLIQKGHFVYISRTQQAFADFAQYLPANQVLTISGAPRVVDAGMVTTSDQLLLNRLSGDTLAQGHVKTTYSDLKSQPGGAWLASSDPIHVTASQMTARSNPAIATYSGGARLWQNANVVAAPSIQFQKDTRTVLADSSSNQKVSMVLVGTDKNGKATPVNVSSSRMTYRDSDHKAHFEGRVAVRGADLTITSNQMDVFLAPSSQKKNENMGGLAPSPVQDTNGQAQATGETPGAPPSQMAAPQSQMTGLSKLEKIVASGSVVITQPNRRATGDQLTYTAADDKFVLTGGPPCIFDAERGKITGVSLTLFRHDDRVVVEGDASTPSVTQTRAVR